MIGMKFTYKMISDPTINDSKYKCVKKFEGNEHNKVCVVTNFEKNYVVKKVKSREELTLEYTMGKVLDHSSILSVFDVDFSNNVMCMEYFESQDLFDIISNGVMVNKLGIWEQLLVVIEYLHENGIAHCDIKLENVLVNKNNELRLIDFGSARNADSLTNTLFGTLGCWSPEQYDGFLLCLKRLICGVWV